MKKLNSINWVSFKGDQLYLEDIPIKVGLDIDKWLTAYNSLEYTLEISEYDKKRKYFEFINYRYIIISIYDKIIDKIIVYPYQYQSSVYYKGDIFIFDKKLEVPFLSDNIEQYFHDIEIKSKGYWDRFIPRESVCYPVSDMVKIEILMGRSPELVGSIILKGIQS